MLHSTLLRGLSAGLLLLVIAAPRTHAVVVSTQYFSTTTNFSGNSGVPGNGGNAFWNIAQDSGPLASVKIDLTVSGSITFFEGNPWAFPILWTPQVNGTLTAGAWGFSSSAALTLTGAPVWIPPAPPVGNATFSPEVTLGFVATFSGLVPEALLSHYVGAGTAPFTSFAHFTMMESFGGYRGTVTHSAIVTFNAPDHGSSLVLLGSAMALCGLAYRPVRLRVLPGA